MEQDTEVKLPHFIGVFENNKLVLRLSSDPIGPVSQLPPQLREEKKMLQPPRQSQHLKDVKILPNSVIYPTGFLGFPLQLFKISYMVRSLNYSFIGHTSSQSLATLLYRPNPLFSSLQLLLKALDTSYKLLTNNLWPPYTSEFTIDCSCVKNSHNSIKKIDFAEPDVRIAEIKIKETPDNQACALEEENTSDTVSVALESCNISGHQFLRPLRNERYFCIYCYKGFKQQMNLEKHICVHTGGRPFICEICSKAFTQQSNLWKHVRTHTGERPFTCEVCNKSFTQQANLRKHLNVHTGERPFMCNICTKQFSQRANLMKHIRTHTGERPFECKYCSKAFAQQSNLVKHERTHTGVKPYVCQICHKSFAQQSNLSKHQAVHLSDKPFPCKLCNKSYTQKVGLQKHEEKHKHKLLSVKLKE